MPEITDEQLQRLKQDSRKLRALEAAGVDNWQGYDYAIELLMEMETEETC